MQKSTIKLPEIKLVGLTVRTSNPLEMDPATAKIGGAVQNYYQAMCADKIMLRKTPWTTYSVYTNYESDFTGEYTYFIGEEVLDFEDQPDEFQQLIIPQQNYTKFTTAPGAMPDVCLSAWQKIWQMTMEDLCGKRAYKADFEIYDQRASDPTNSVLDIYVGII